MKSFPTHLYESFARINGWLLGGLGLLLSVAIFFFGPETKILVGWLVGVVAISAVMFAVLADAAYCGWKSS